MAEPFYSGKPQRSPLIPIVAGVLALILVPIGWGAYNYVQGNNGDDGAASGPPTATPPTTPSTPPLDIEPSIYDYGLPPIACPIDWESATRHTAHKADLYGHLAVIAGDVAYIRQHSFKETVHTRNLTSAQFKAKLKRSTTPKTRKARELTRIYGQALELLRVIPNADDYGKLVTDVATTQVAGFYDPERKKVFVPGSVTDPSPLDELVLSHELEHALADQVLGLPIKDSASDLESDRQFAVRAIIEGDAQLTSFFYATSRMSQEELAEIGSDPTVTEAEEQEIPHALERSINFPYTEGSQFVCFLYNKGGWKAVDRAYRRPPTSTADIIFPNRFGRSDPPRDAPNPETPRGWRRVELTTSGPLDLLTLFEAPNGEVIAEPSGVVDRVRRWNGGEFGIFSDGEGRVAITLTEVDDPSLTGDAQTPHMCVQMQLWFSQNYPDAEEIDSGTDEVLGRDLGDAIALLRCSIEDPNITLAVAPDMKTASTLIGVKPQHIAP